MICERCGRLLNRATGKCVVCADHGGDAPPPVATREALAGPDGPQDPRGPADPGAVERSVAATLRPVAPGPSPVAPPVAPPSVAPPAPPEQPISMSAAVAILDLSDPADKPAKPARPASPPPPPAEPPPPPRLPGAPVGVVRAARHGRRKVDLVAYDGNLVIAKRGAPENLTSSQLAAQDPSSRVLAAQSVDEAVVREDAVSGQVRIKVKAGDDIVIRWPGWKNRGVSAENLLAHAFPGKVDQGSPEIAKRTVRLMGGLGAAILVAVLAYLGLSALLKGDPPPPPPPAPTTTLPPAEQAARAALQPVCPGWQQFAGSVPTGERPDPTAMRPVIDAMRGPLVSAADTGAHASYTTARDESAYLQDYARRPVDDVARESVSRVAFALRSVTAACDRATSAS